MNNPQCCGELRLIVDILDNLIMSPSLQPLPEEFADNLEIVNLYEYLSAIRNILDAFSKGDFNLKVPIKGSLGGMLKTLQGNLRHLSWQVQMVSKGDFTQRVDFMGEFSEAFNSMVVQMDSTLKELREQELQLYKITEDLRNEIAVRAKVEEALKKSHKRYQELAFIDPLTNLNNRRHFFELANVELKRMQRTGGVATIAMLDVDFFKHFNDTYGHLAGDKCLKIVASKMQEYTRDVDIVARYGGEEFVLILPQTGVETGLLVAERLRSEIEASSVVIDDIAVAKVTVSIGITEIRAEQTRGANVDDLFSHAIQEADMALYHVKRNGRNRVMAYKDIELES